MGNSVGGYCMDYCGESANCFDRLGKRRPDGPLIRSAESAAFIPAANLLGTTPTDLNERTDRDASRNYFCKTLTFLNVTVGTSCCSCFTRLKGRRRQRRTFRRLSLSKIQFPPGVVLVDQFESSQDIRKIEYSKHEENTNRIKSKKIVYLELTSKSSREQSFQSAGIEPPASPKPRASPSASPRPSRRRPSISPAKAMLQMSEHEEEEEESEEEEEEDLEGSMSLSELKQQKLGEFRQNLSVTVKLGTGVLASTVKLGLNRKCTALEWYGKDKKHSTELPLNTIVKIQTVAGNPNGLEIQAKNPSFETHTFTFRDKESRKTWQDTMESFQRFAATAR